MDKFEKFAGKAILNKNMLTKITGGHTRPLTGMYKGARIKLRPLTGSYGCALGG